LDAMAVDFQKSNYSIQHVIKTIMKSNAYQLSAKFPAEWKDAYTPYYARKYIRFMTGPEVADAIGTATGRPLGFNLQGVTMTRLNQLTFPETRPDVGPSTETKDPITRPCCRRFSKVRVSHNLPTAIVPQ